MPLPSHECDAIPHKGSTTGLGKNATIAAMIAMIALVGSPVRVQRPSVLIPLSRHRGRAPQPARLNVTSDYVTTHHDTEKTGLRALSPTEVNDDNGDQRMSARELHQNEAQVYPTDAKEREKAQRKKLKAEGKEHQAKKRKKVVEDHYDDCGDDLSSLRDEALSGLAYPDLLHDVLMLKADEYETCQFEHRQYGDPLPKGMDATAVGISPPSAPTYVREVDGMYKRPPLKDCEGCHMARDAEHPSRSRIEGKCRYPHVVPKE